jgi:hypothetical protein
MPQRPIIYANRPYAILSMLIGKLAGFVFDGGSTPGLRQGRDMTAMRVSVWTLRIMTV